MLGRTGKSRYTNESRTPIDEPEKIIAVTRSRAAPGIRDVEDGPIHPFLDLGVPVCETDSAGVIVVGGWTIDPFQRRARGVFHQETVVDARGVLVHQQPSVDRSWH